MVLSILEIVLLMFVCIEIQDREWECVPNKVGIIVHGKLDSSVYLVAHTQTFTASNGPFMLRSYGSAAVCFVSRSELGG
jgi:hypothetical protein